MNAVSIGHSRIELVQGDITMQDVDAIVNAANSGLLGGGGVDGAIHRAGGPRILEECREIRRRRGGCPPGEAVMTGGGNLRARYVIHAVGPIWRGGSADEEHILASAYRASLHLAVDHHLGSVAFPSISTGAYGFPVEHAARVALSTAAEFIREHGSPGLVRFVLFSAHDEGIYARLLKGFGVESSP